LADKTVKELITEQSNLLRLKNQYILFRKQRFRNKGEMYF